MTDPIPTPASTTAAASTGTDPALVVTTPTGWASVANHIQNWLEGYVWAPISILGIILFAKFATFLTGRKPLDQGYDFVGLGVKLSICVFLILLLSIAKQALDVWPTKAEQVQHVKHLIWAQRIMTIVLSIVFAWIINH